MDDDSDLIFTLIGIGIPYFCAHAQDHNHSLRVQLYDSVIGSDCAVARMIVIVTIIPHSLFHGCLTGDQSDESPHFSLV